MNQHRQGLEGKERVIRAVLFLSVVFGLTLISPITKSSASPKLSGNQELGRLPLSVGGQTLYLPLVSRMIAGTPIFGIWNSSPSGEYFNKTAQANISWTQGSGVIWSNVEPNQGDRNWAALSSLELLLSNSSSSNLIQVVTVRSTPLWAQLYPGVYCGPIKSDKFDEFASFMHDLVARYSQPPYNVKNWEIWNEPDIDRDLVFPTETRGCWGDDGDTYYGGEYYGDMLQVVYPAIKSADSNARVFVGGLLLDCHPDNGPQCSPSNFLEGILVSGAGNSFDGVAFHAYDYYNNSLGTYGNANWSSFWQSTGPVLIAKADFLREVMSDYGFHNKSLLNNETAILCPAEVGGFDCTADFEITKAYYIAQSAAAALANNLLGNIWYSIYYDAWPVSRYSGLLDGSQQPLPAYYAYQDTADALSGLMYLREITEYSNVMGYEFIASGQIVWVLWSQNSSVHALTLPSTPASASRVDSSGNVVAISPTNPLNVSMAPVFLEWP